MLFLYFFLLFFSMCVFFSVCVCVVCVSLARRHGEEHAARGRALHWECAPRRNSKQMCQLCQANSQKSTQIGDFSTRLSPKQLHNFKKTFRLYHATPPKQSVQICKLFHGTSPKRLLQFLPTPWPRDICVQISPTGFSHNFPRLTQNTCVTASLARFLKVFEALVLCTPCARSSLILKPLEKHVSKSSPLGL